MRSGSRPTPLGPLRPAPSRAAKLGLGLGSVPANGRAEVLQVAARAGLTLFDAAEGAEPQLAAHNRLMVTIESRGLRAPVLEERLRLVRERAGAGARLDFIFEGARLLADDGPALWKEARRLRELGLCDALGVAAAPGGDALGLARRFRPDLMHISAGLLDQRLIQNGAAAEAAALGIEVHLRMVLLHGLLFLPREGLSPALADAGPKVSRVRRLIAEAGADPLQAALSFALERREASGVIVEAGSPGEVRAVLAAASAPPPLLDWPALALDHPAALDAEAQLRRVAA